MSTTPSRIALADGDIAVSDADPDDDRTADVSDAFGVDDDDPAAAEHADGDHHGVRTDDWREAPDRRRCWRWQSG